MRISKRDIIIFILSGLIFSFISVSASVSFLSKNISYSNSSSEVTNVEDALNELYDTENKCVAFLYNKTFPYTGTVQTFTTQKSGYYKFEAWGAQGAGSQSRGAYTTGSIYLNKDQAIYVYVGQGNVYTYDVTSFNGGTGNCGGYPGGGATDFRLVAGSWNEITSLRSRIMVAAGSGSGSGNNNINLGAGGALTGFSGGGTVGGTQTTFGGAQISSYTASSFGIANGGCAGGNGYYPGGGSTCVNGAGGGSSFISGYQGCVSVSSSTSNNPKAGCVNGTTDITCSYHYSGLVFSNTNMIAGNASMPSHDGTETMIGNTDNGYAKISYLGTSLN